MGPEADATEVDVDTVLVTADGSDASHRAAEYAVAVAGRYGADLHVLYVVDEHLMAAIESGDVDSSVATRETRSFVSAVTEMAAHRPVAVNASTAYAFSTTRKRVHPGSVILDTAEELAVDFVVIPRESDAESTGVLEKAAEYVLQYASQPVLSV